MIDGYEIKLRIRGKDGAKLWAVYLNGKQATLYFPDLATVYRKLEFLREDDRQRAAKEAAKASSEPPVAA